MTYRTLSIILLSIHTHARTRTHTHTHTHTLSLSLSLSPNPSVPPHPLSLPVFLHTPIVTGQSMKTCKNNNNNKIRYSMQCLLGGYSSSEEAGVKRKVLRDVLNTEWSLPWMHNESDYFIFCSCILLVINSEFCCTLVCCCCCILLVINDEFCCTLVPFALTGH